MNWKTTISYFILLVGNFFLALVVWVDRKKHKKDPKEPLERLSYRLLAIVVVFDVIGICLAGWGEYATRAPRTLNWLERRTLGQELSKYRGQRFRVVVAADNLEGLGFAQILASCLRDDCGWKGSVGIFDRVILSPGVAVIPSGDDVMTDIKLGTGMPIFHSLYVAFDDAGVQTSSMGAGIPLEDQPPFGTIDIYVGPKP